MSLIPAAFDAKEYFRKYTTVWKPINRISRCLFGFLDASGTAGITATVRGSWHPAESAVGRLARYGPEI